MNQLDTLCQKLNATTETLVPKVIEFGKYEDTITTIVLAVVFCALASASIIFYVKGHRKECSYDEDTIYFVLFISSTIIGAIIFVAFISYVIDLIKWNSYPEMMAYKYILNVIGNGG